MIPGKCPKYPCSHSYKIPGEFWKYPYAHRQDTHGWRGQVTRSDQFFLFPVKKIFLCVKVFRFRSVKVLRSPWKNLEKCPWKHKRLRENIFEITCVKLDCTSIFLEIPSNKTEKCPWKHPYNFTLDVKTVFKNSNGKSLFWWEKIKVPF